MNKLIIIVAALTVTIAVFILYSPALASEDIFGLRIENITRDSADFFWSTSIETKGSVEYAYSKLPNLYNPQLSGTSATVLISALPLQVRSEENYVKFHHVKVDKLDLNSCPFVQYTIKSQVFNGATYLLSGEFVLVDTNKVNWWQTVWYVVPATIILFLIAWFKEQINDFCHRIYNRLRHLRD